MPHPTPTTEQLLHLLDRAIDGRLLPAERPQLRDGIRHLVASLAGTSAAQRRATAEAEQLLEDVRARDETIRHLQAGLAHDRAELEQLHAGEEPHPDMTTVATPAQWIWHWNRATPERRLEVAAAVQDACNRADRCVVTDHEGRLAEQDACRIVDVDGAPVRITGDTEMTDQEQGYAAEIIRGARRRYVAEHGTPQCPPACADGRAVDDHIRLATAVRDILSRMSPEVVTEMTPAQQSQLADLITSARAHCERMAQALTPITEQPAAPYQVWPLARILAEVQCGSGDWPWEDEWADLDTRDADRLEQLEQDIRDRGITTPVLIGSDGRLWDGHHRLRVAVRLGIGYVPVEVTPSTAPEQS